MLSWKVHSALFRETDQMSRKSKKGGNGVKQEESAVSWFQLTANEGNPIAQNSLGRMFKDGDGVKQDDKLAVLWFQMSANNGNP